MMADKKTDNSHLETKLELRREMLRKYQGKGSLAVIDCCQGSGVIWSILREEFKLGSYWGLDTKKAPGRLQIDSARVLCQPGWRADVIDVDTYGAPWAHWEALLPNVTGAVTIFLTIGQTMMMTHR